MNKAKCKFLVLEVINLGFKINKEEIYLVENKVQAVKDAPYTTNVTELKAYLGMLNYYNSFLPQISTLPQPLHAVLHKQTPWK